MKTGIIATIAAAGLATVMAASAWAQSLPLPSGSYSRTCTDARALSQAGGRLLTARCQTANGGQERSSLRYENCRGDIGNNNGKLFCSTNGGGNNDRPPTGSYQQSCTDAVMQGSTLSAVCRDSRGQRVRSSINTRDCRGRDIANINGRLSCTSAGGGGGNDRPPSGSYTQSCSNIDMRGSILSAVCRDGRGNSVRTSLDTRDCRGRDIANVNGRLNCSTGPGNGGGGGGVPTGSYQRTCSNPYMNGNVLHATCKLTFGSSTRRTSIDTRECRGRDIVNVNGQLSCTANGGTPPPPVGAKGVITLFTQPGYAGRNATIDRPAATLGAWQMADKARSLQVRSGRWQLCSEPNFRGRCVTVDRNQRDLRSLGLDGQISSVQPVR